MEPLEVLVQEFDDSRLHPFFVRRTQERVVVYGAHVPMCPSYRSGDAVQAPEDLYCRFRDGDAIFLHGRHATFVENRLSHGVDTGLYL